jgi:hypothetical protein
VREAGRSRGDARERSINVFSEGITMATIDERVYPNGSVKYRVRTRLEGFRVVSATIAA